MTDKHKPFIRRLTNSTKTRIGVWEFRCTCGQRKVATGQMVVMREMRKHEREITEFQEEAV